MYTKKKAKAWQKNVVILLVLLLACSFSPSALAADETQTPDWASDAALAVSRVSGTGFNLSWPAADGAENYRVVVSITTGGVTTGTLDTTTGDTSLAVTGLTANRHYDIAVTAANSAGDSPDSLTGLVVTTPTQTLFEFMPAALSDSTYRYKFQPAATKDSGRSGDFETVYVYDNALDPASTNFVWYVQGGFNNALASIKDDVKAFRLFNLTDGNEVALDYGDVDTNFTGSPGTWTYGVGKTSGDFVVTRLSAYSVHFSFQLDIAKYLEADKEYAVTIDPQFNTGGSYPNVLGKVNRYEFSTFVNDTQAPEWGSDDEISLGQITAESIELSWPAATDDTGVAKYKIKVSDNDGVIDALETSATSYTVTGLTSNTEYSFSISALDAARNESSPLPAVAAKTLPAVPVWSAGAGLTAESVLATELVLRWPQVSNTGDLAGYKVYVDGAEEASLPAMQIYYELTGLSSGQKYILAVKPFNETGELGAALETMVVTPGAGGLTFTFAPAATDLGESGYYHNYQINNPVDMESFSLAWNFSNGLDKNLRFNLECIHLIEKSSGQELTLDLGTEPYVSTLEGVFYAGDFKYISTGGGGGGGTGGGTGGSGDDGSAKTRMLKFEPEAATLAQMTKGAEYVIEFDPEFTANNGTAKLGKIFAFEFSTAVDDNEAPAWPAGAQITAGKVGTDAFVLSWPQATDNIGITEYQLYRQNQTLELIQAFGSQTTSYKMEGLTPGAVYNLVLRARDAKANYTPDLTIAVTTLLTDDLAPVWPAASKLSADNILFDTLDLNWTAADDNVEVTGYRILKNGETVKEVGADTLTCHLTGLAPATSYMFKVEARDKAGNYSTIGPKLVISTLDGVPDTTPPVWTTNGSYSTSTVYGYDKTYPTYKWPWAADNVAVTAYLVYRNGVQVAVLDAYTNSYSDVLNNDGSSYTYSVYAVDASGNRSVEGRPMSVPSGSPNQDTFSPIWPAGTNITLSEFTDTTMKVKWTPAQDNVAIRGYVVIKDGLWVEWGDRGEPESDHRSFQNCFVVYNPIYNPGPAVNYPPLVSGQTYTFSVKAFDPTENSSKGDPQITFVMGTNPTAGSGIPFALTNVENRRGSLNSLTGAVNQVEAPVDPENTRFVWEFDEPLAAGYTDLVTLTNAATGGTVALDPADFLYHESGGKGILTLDLAQTGIKLADKTTYIVKLDKTLAAQSGKKLGFDMAWQFTSDVADKQSPQWGAGDTLTVNFIKAPAIAMLTWPAAGDNVAVTSYRIYQGDNLLATLPAETLSYEVPDLTADTAYTFKVIAGDYLENLSAPIACTATVPAADNAAPIWLPADALTFSDITSDNLQVSWPAASDNYKVKEYKIYLNGSSEPLGVVAGEDIPTFTVTGLAGETAYNIAVKAIDFSGNTGELAGSVTTGPDTSSPVWPAGSSLKARDIRDTSVTLYWDAAADNVGVTQYTVYRDGEQLLTINGNTTEAAVSGLNGATKYTFAVEAEDLKGNKTTDKLSLEQWTAPNSTTLGAAFPFRLEKPLSHNISSDPANNTLNNVVDGSFTKNNVAFTFAFSKKLADGTWLNNIEMKDHEGTAISLASAAYTYMETADNASKLKIIVPADLVANGEYSLTVKSDLQAADLTLLGRNFIWKFNVSLGMYGVTDIAAGFYTNGLPVGPAERFYLMVKDDGSVWTWGNNTYGTLGDGTTDRREIPTQVDGLSGVVSVEAGRNSSFAIDQDGAVWGWGSNEYGQLGRGTVPGGTSGRYGNNTPVKVNGLPAIEKISFGYGHIVALDINGEVWNWGNAVQAGYAEEVERSGIPLKISGLSNVVDVAGGYNASLAVTGNGDVYKFDHGKTPVKIEGLSEIVAVDAQDKIWMALKADGTAYIWDSLYDYQGTVSATPLKIADATLVKSVVADGPHILGTNGQVSYVTYAASPVMGAEISALNNVVKLASSANGGLALQTDGKLLQFIGTAVTEVPLNMDPAQPPVWPEDSKLTVTNLAETGLDLNWTKPDPNVSGYAIYIDGSRVITLAGDTLSYDVLGLTKGQTYTFKVEARYINSGWTTTGPQISQTMNEWNPAMQDSGKLAVSGRHVLMAADDGSVWAWGQNDYGQLGIGNTIEQLTPVRVDGLTNIVAVAAGDNHSLALDKDGNVWAWGRNNVYQLGNNSTANSNIPIKIISGNMKDISAAANYSLALKNDGSVWGWGEPCNANCSFALEGGSGHIPVQMCYNTSRPSDVHPFAGIKDIAASRSFIAYLSDDGRIIRQGSFIDEVGAPTYSPMPHYSAPLGISAIAAGENFAIGLKGDGTVLSLGDNNAGQYGNGTIGNGTPADPRPYGVVTGLTNIMAIAAGGYHGLALDRDGNVYTWGKNLYGQLGTGKTDIHLTPVKVVGLAGITAVGGGTESSMAFKNMEKVYAWGNNDSGQLGNNGKTTSKVPALVRMAGYEADIDAPVWPAFFALVPTVMPGNSLTLDWTPAGDDHGVTGYEIYLNGEKAADVDGALPEYTFSGLSADTPYLIGLKAKDAAGNISAFSRTVQVELRPRYTVSAENDSAYTNGQTPDGINTMTVNDGVSGLKYFSVHVAPVRAHTGSEVVIFVHLRNGAQLGINAAKADFDITGTAEAGFNVQQGDMVKSYIVDDLTNDININPVVLQ